MWKGRAYMETWKLSVLSAPFLCTPKKDYLSFKKLDGKMKYEADHSYRSLCHKE